MMRSGLLRLFVFSVSLLAMVSGLSVPAHADGPIVFDNLQDLGELLQVDYRMVKYNRRTGVQRTTVIVTNTSGEAIRCPLVFVISSISAPGVTLRNPDGTTPDNAPFIDLSADVGEDGVLAPGESTAKHVITFANPDRSRFSIDSACLGTLILGPPSPPVVTPIPRITRAATVEITGIAAGGTEVEISAPTGVITQAVGTDGSFTVSVPLEKNHLNRIFVTTLSGPVRSAPTSLLITRDKQPPALQIQFPSDGAEVFAETTDVAGFVSDRLSGFERMKVRVNGNLAEINIGIGTNGTFFLPSLPLVLGTNEIRVVASDALGNGVAKTITVIRNEIPENVATIQLVSGNAQQGQIESLLDEPIVVQLSKQDGTPFANKIVDFKVTRSNGRVSEDGNEGEMLYQVRTNAAGRAEARWMLGSDAGCGNNRVNVTSKDIFGTVVFCATSMPGPPQQINIGNSNYLRVEAGAPLTEPLSAWVSDSCNGIPDVPVTFTVVQGDGLVNGQTSVTVMSGKTGHAEADFVVGVTGGENRVEANFEGSEISPAVFVAYGLVRDESVETSLRGIVIDNGTNPIGGAKCTLVVNGQVHADLFTDSSGQFEFVNTPDGSAHLLIDGLVANMVNGQSVPEGSFPSLAFEFIMVPNAENSLPSPVMLPPLDPQNAVEFDNTQDVELTVAGIDGLKMLVMAGSMVRPDGTIPSADDPAILSLNPVHHDDIPMPMPDGAAPPFAWTLQPGGATFDPPIQLQYPNMSGLPAGAASFFLSFDHDTGKFEIVAPGRVSDDGSIILSDPGTGLTLAGWGCNCPPYEVTEDCENCDKDDMPPCESKELSADFKKASDLVEKALSKIPFVEISDVSISGSVKGEVCPTCCNGKPLMPGTVGISGSVTASATISKDLLTLGVNIPKFQFKKTLRLPVFGEIAVIEGKLDIDAVELSLSPVLKAGVGGTRNLCNKTNCFTVNGCAGARATLSLGIDLQAKASDPDDASDVFGEVVIKAVASATANAAATVEFGSGDCPSPGTKATGCLGSLTGKVEVNVFGASFMAGPYTFIKGTAGCGCN